MPEEQEKLVIVFLYIAAKMLGPKPGKAMDTESDRNSETDEDTETDEEAEKYVKITDWLGPPSELGPSSSK